MKQETTLGPTAGRGWFSVVVLVALAVADSSAQSSLDGFDAYVEAAVADWEAPGLAVAVVKDGDLIFAEGYGVRELGKPDAVDTETLFAIGSTTKAMTAAAILMLADEGKLALDDPVIEHLPDFRLYDPYVTREITLRDLLTHRAGLPNADFLWYGQTHTTEEIVRAMRFVEQETSLRSHFTYQNIMYAAAGEVVEALSGAPWDVFIRERIFEPLQMTGTIPTAGTLSEQPNVASPHYRVDGTVEVIDNASVDAVASAGSVWSSVSDMSRWMRMLLAGGVTEDGTRLISEAMIAEMFKPQFIVGPDGFYPTAELTKPHWTTYGLGWFQEDYKGHKVDFHTGSIDGMVAIIGLIRDEGLGVYVLSNLDHAEVRHALMYRVFDAYTNDELRDWSADLKVLYDRLSEEAEQKRLDAEAERVPDTSPSHALDAYLGTYSDELYGKISISKETKDESALRLYYGPGLQGRMEHWSYDTFRVQWDAAWRGSTLVTFELDERSGSVRDLVILGGTFRRSE